MSRDRLGLVKGLLDTLEEEAGVRAGVAPGGPGTTGRAPVAPASFWPAERSWLGRVSAVGAFRGWQRRAGACSASSRPQP